jgi:hypothetical protein
MVDPRFDAGAVNETLAVLLLVAKAEILVGASGIPAAKGITAFEAVEAAPVPAPFVAAIVKV